MGCKNQMELRCTEQCIGDWKDFCPEAATPGQKEAYSFFGMICRAAILL